MSKIIKAATRKKRRAGGKEKIYLNIELDLSKFRLTDTFNNLEELLEKIEALKKTCPNLIVQIEASLK